MAKLNVLSYNNLVLYDELLKNYISEADAKALKTVAIDGFKLKFYTVEEPVGETAPAFEIELPKTDLSGVLAKLTGAVEGDVVVANADGTVKDSGVKLADLATKASVDAINNEETGILAQAKKYADDEVKELADGQVKTNKEAIEKLNGDAETEGSVAKAVKDAVDGINETIGELTEGKTIVEMIEAATTNAKVTMSTDVTTEGYLKTYTLKQGETEIGKIDIAKDLVVTAGEVVVNPEGQPEGTYVKLTIANQEAPIYINVKDLVDVYTAKAEATQVQVAISETNEISATLVAGGVGTTELANGAVTTAKIADANVTAAKLSDDAKALFDAAGTAKALEDGQVATNKTDIASLKQLVGEGVEEITQEDIYALFATDEATE